MPAVLPTLTPALRRRLRGLRHLALDMDGTLYQGARLFPETLPFVETLKRLGVGFTYLTNNSSRSRVDYVKKLRALGLPAALSQVYTSTHATLDYLRRRYPRARTLLALGTASFRAELRRAGYRLLDPDRGRHAPPTGRQRRAQTPDLVLVGFDMELTYDRLCLASYWVAQGKPFLATHPDLICPSDPTTVLVDCGALVQPIVAVTGVQPTAIGKPNPAILRQLARRLKLAPAQVGMVGDRLYTDIAMAQRAGSVSMLVLTGETGAGPARRYRPRPEVIAANVGVLASLLTAARR